MRLVVRGDGVKKKLELMISKMPSPPCPTKVPHPSGLGSCEGNYCQAMFADARPPAPAWLPPASDVIMLADARPPALHALALFTGVLADARPATLRVPLIMQLCMHMYNGPNFLDKVLLLSHRSKSLSSFQLCPDLFRNVLCPSAPT